MGPVGVHPWYEDGQGSSRDRLRSVNPYNAAVSMRLASGWRNYQTVALGRRSVLVSTLWEMPSRASW
jgi:hypothetical protein